MLYHRYRCGRRRWRGRRWGHHNRGWDERRRCWPWHRHGSWHRAVQVKISAAAPQKGQQNDDDPRDQRQGRFFSRCDGDGCRAPGWRSGGPANGTCSGRCRTRAGAGSGDHRRLLVRLRRDQRVTFGGVADRSGEFRRVGEPVLRPFRHRFSDDPIERRWRCHRNLRRQRRFGVQGLVHDRRHAAFERTFAGQQLVEQDTGGINIGPRIDHLSHDLFRGHVSGRAQHGARLRHRGAFDSGDTEIGDFSLALAREHDVGRLDIAMHHAAVVAEFQARQQIAHDLHGIGDGEAVPLVHQSLQWRAVDVFHHDVRDIAGFAVIEHPDDIGMGQAAGGLCFSAEAGQRLFGFGIGCVRQIDGLDRNASFDDGVPALIDRSHCAAPKLALDLVLAEGLDRRHAAPCVSVSDAL